MRRVLFLGAWLFLLSGITYAFDQTPPFFPGAIIPNLITSGSMFQSGHFNMAGAAPSLSAACGTGATILGSDMSWQVTIGTAPSSPCVLTFVNVWPTNSWCNGVNNTSTARLITVPSTTTTASITGAPLASDKIVGMCMGN